MKDESEQKLVFAFLKNQEPIWAMTFDKSFECFENIRFIHPPTLKVFPPPLSDTGHFQADV